jgi:ribose transport system permease protein
VFLSFVVSGAAAGLGGVLLVADSGAGNPSVGSVFTLTALTAAFLGATSVKPGRFNVVGTLLAISFLAAAITGLTFAGVQDYINDLFTVRAGPGGRHLGPAGAAPAGRRPLARGLPRRGRGTPRPYCGGTRIKQ